MEEFNSWNKIDWSWHEKNCQSFLQPSSGSNFLLTFSRFSEFVGNFTSILYTFNSFTFRTLQEKCRSANLLKNDSNNELEKFLRKLYCHAKANSRRINQGTVITLTVPRCSVKYFYPRIRSLEQSESFIYSTQKRHKPRSCFCEYSRKFIILLRPTKHKFSIGRRENRSMRVINTRCVSHDRSETKTENRKMRTDPSHISVLLFFCCGIETWCKFPPISDLGKHILHFPSPTSQLSNFASNFSTFSCG